MAYLEVMGKWPCRIVLSVMLSASGCTLFAQATWERRMEVALQSAARQDYTASEKGMMTAIRDLEASNPADIRLGPAVNSLGLVYRAENKLREAESAFRRALAHIEKTNPPTSIDVGNSNMNLGSVLLAEGRYNEAEPFLQKALRIFSRQLGDKSPKTATVEAQLGEMYRNLHDDSQAEMFLKKALDIQESARGLDDPEVAATINSLAELYAGQSFLTKAEPLFKLVMSIRESTAGMNSPEFATAVERYADILERLGRVKESARHRKLAAALRSMHKSGAASSARSKEPVDLSAPPLPAEPIEPAPLRRKRNSVAQIQ